MTITPEGIETLARWYNTLNSWEWPEDLPNKPEGFDEMPNALSGDDRTHPEMLVSRLACVSGAMEVIQAIIGEQECLRWLHLHKLGRSNVEFEEWWAQRCQRVHLATIEVGEEDMA